jgi:hypothetical protein
MKHRASLYKLAHILTGSGGAEHRRSSFMGVKCFRGIDQTFRPYIWQTDYVSECSIFRKLGINTMVEQ